MKKIFLFLALILMISSAFAYTYYAPIEPDNKLTIYGEGSKILCKANECTYRYSITNNDSIAHTLNLIMNTTQNISSTTITKEIIYDVVPTEYITCTETQVITDLNGQKHTDCIKTGKTTINQSVPRIKETLTPNPTKKGDRTLIFSTAKGQIVATPKTATQTTLSAGETKYFQTTFYPTTQTGELVITALSDSNPTIKASLDPTWVVPDTYIDSFEDGDFNSAGRNPRWSNVTGADIYVRDGTAYNGTKELRNHGGYLDLTLTYLPTTRLFSAWYKSELAAASGNYNGGINLKKSTGATIIDFQKGYGAGGTFQYYAGGTWNSTGIVATSATWFNLEVYYTDGNATAVYNIYDSTGDRVYSSENAVASAGTVASLRLLVDNAASYAEFDYVPTNIAVTNYDINFNVYNTGTSTHINNFNMDCNDNTYDGNFNSPKNWTIKNGTYLCTFTATYHDSNTNFLVQADANKTYTIYLVDHSPTSYNIDFNVLDSATYTNLTNFNMDCNDNTYDGNFNSPKQWSVAGGHYACRFTRTGYDANGNGTTTLFINADSNKSFPVYLLNQDLNADLTIRVRDENTGLDLTGVTATFSSGQAFNINTSNTIDLNFLANTTTNYTITFTKTGYGTRYYQFDGNRKMDNWDLNFLMLPNSLGATTPFKVYQPDQNTLYTNTYFQLNRLDRNSWISGRLKTNATAETNLFINIFDQNYSELANDTNTYYLVALTISYPKDEVTLAQISETWKITTLTNISVTYTDLNTSKIMYLLPNINNPYNLSIVDTNGNYFARTYAQQYKGNPLTDTLQPYLIKTTAGILTTFIAQDPSTFFVIPNVTIKVYKTLPVLGRTLVENLVTDGKGQATAIFVLSNTYDIEVYYDGNWKFTKSFISTLGTGGTAPTVYVLINMLSSVSFPLGGDSFFVMFSPGLQVLRTGVTSLDQNISLNKLGSSTTITSLFIWVTNTDINGIPGNDVNIYSTTVLLPTLPYVNSIPINLTNHTLNGVAYDDNGTLVVHVQINSSIGIGGWFYTYTFPKGYDFQYLVGFNLRPLFGCPLTADPLMPCPSLLLAAIFISLIVSVVVAAGVGYISVNSLGWLFILIMGIFTYLTWVPYILTALMVVGMFGLMVAEAGRQRV